MTQNNLIREFEQQLEKNINEVVESIYRPQSFINMVDKYGYYQAAKKIASDREVSDGFTKLALKQRLDLSIESLIVNPKYESIFTKDEINNCRIKLR